jgi:hypothetical protein
VTDQAPQKETLIVRYVVRAPDVGLFPDPGHGSERRRRWCRRLFDQNRGRVKVQRSLLANV